MLTDKNPISYQIMIHDRNYNSWSFYDNITGQEIIHENTPLSKIIPLEHKLLSKDIFTLTVEGILTITNSQAREVPYYAGVLLLENNKTYGRTPNKKRLLYKCVPDDKHLPPFLVPYDIKIGFSKVFKNKYITFQYDNWLNTVHPYGLIKETLGDVDNLEAFYEYQLYCKSLHISITDITNRTRETLNKKTQDEYIESILKNTQFQIQDRSDSYIFTIDPPQSLDFDDGFSIVDMPDGNSYKVSVYIANVYFWLEILGLWSSFSRRVATIYLPDRRRPMLPTILSDTLCSLQANQTRFAFCFDVIVDRDGKILKEPQFSNAMIRVSKNYHYEDPKMLAKDEHYKKLLEVTKKMAGPTISTNSHDLVSFWMVQMNKSCAQYMVQHKFGIFRTSTIYDTTTTINHDPDTPISLLDEDTRRVIQLWNNSSGNYILYNEDNASLEHMVMNAKSYIHITSPIRRLVDLLNQMQMMQHLGSILPIQGDARQFLDKWTREIDYINTSMRSIRKIQTDCNILHRCFQSPDIIGQVHEGVVFDRLVMNNNRITYMVYLEKLKLLSRITTTTDFDNLTKHSFQIFLFEDEHSTKKKIRLQYGEPTTREP